MESIFLCSEDGVNQAVVSCFCRSPLSLVCAAHLNKHPVNTDGFLHFHLPPYASECIKTPEVRAQYSMWLFRLHNAYAAIREKERVVSRVEEELEATRLELLQHFEAQLTEKVARAKESIAEFRKALRAEVERAVMETSQHATEAWTPGAGSLSELVWNYDMEKPASLDVFRVAVEKVQQPLGWNFRLSISTQLKSLSRCNTREDIPDQESTRELRTELENSKKELNAACGEIAKLREEVNRLQRLLTEKEQEQLNIPGMRSILAKHASEEPQSSVRRSASETAPSPTLAQDVTIFQIDGGSLRALDRSRLAWSRKIPFNTALENGEHHQYLLLDNNQLFYTCKASDTAHSNCCILSLTSTLVTVTPLPQMNTERVYAGLLFSAGTIFTFGGVDCLEGKMLADGEKERLKDGETVSVVAAQQWKRLPGEMQEAREQFTPCEYQRKVYLAGGMKALSIEVFDLERWTFHQMASVRLPEATACIAWVASNRLTVFSENYLVQLSLTAGQSELKVKPHTETVVTPVCAPLAFGDVVIWLSCNRKRKQACMRLTLGEAVVLIEEIC